MRIIKLGGSLLNAQTLQYCLDNIEQRYLTNTVIVPGGGVFAEQVRLTQQHWQFDDNTAHEMALLAMQQMALLFKGLKPNFVIVQHVAQLRRLLATPLNTPLIWSPDSDELKQAAIGATWDITSDSLAAWLANTLLADDLILVKSTPINPHLSLDELSSQGIIDRAFSGFVTNTRFKLIISHSENF